jgi:circadian clock protein KaiC
MERVHTGNKQLDRILGGGFPANSIHIVMGSPGCGKTILAEQLAFANATSERPVLYLTTISEPLPKLLSYLQEYTFADVGRVGTDVLYSSIGDVLTQDPGRLSEVVAELVLRHRPSVVVIDSFKAIADLVVDRAAWRRQLHDLAGLLSAYRTTTFWIGEYVSEVELSREQHGSRDFRFLHVVKLRGSGFLDGYHAVQIHKSGLEYFPRLRTPDVPPTYHPADDRLSSGIEGLDRLIATGWLRGTSTVLVGPSGAGKTVMGLQFAREGAIHGEPALFVTFEENPTQIGRVVEHFGWDPPSLLGPGKLDVWFASPVELQIDTIVRELLGRIEQHRVRRVVIDGLGDLAYTADDPIRFRDYLFALVQQFAARGVTSMLTVQNVEPGASPAGLGEITYLGDNLLLLEMQLGEELTRTVRILKTRGSAHDGFRRPLSIGAGGIVIG